MNKVDYQSRAYTEPMGLLVFKLIHTGQADYTTAITSELGSNKQTVTNYLKGLENTSVIEPKNSDDRRNRYTAHIDLLIHNWFKGTKDDIESLKEHNKDQKDSYEDLLSDFTNHKDEITRFAEDYFESILEEFSVQELADMSINKVLIEEFTFSAMYIYLAGREDIDLEKLREEKWVEVLYRALMVTNVQGRTVPIMEKVLKQELNNPD